jgi:hypothetical protein
MKNAALSGKRASRVLSLRKLSTSEDEGLQRELKRIARADRFARELVIAGAIPDLGEDWARVHESIGLLVGDDDADPDPLNYQEWSYYLGIAVGIRLAGGQP